MIRLKNPEFCIVAVIDECVKSLAPSNPLAGRLNESKELLQHIEEYYRTHSSNGHLYQIPATSKDLPKDHTIICSLTKEDLIKVYEEHFVPKTKPLRRLYESLITAAKNECPYCGGLGEPHNLDHFLPKADFPSFAFVPINLVPSCRDCNMGNKKNAFATNEGSQTIQPYADKELFFNEQWIYASYEQGTSAKPGRFDYIASPPDHWLETDKLRALEHFNSFNIKTRYEYKANAAQKKTLASIQHLRTIGLSEDTITRTILQPVIDSAPFINHWEVGMIQAMIKSYMDSD